MTRGEMIVDFVLARTNGADSTVGAEMPGELRNRLVVGDRGCLNAELQAELRAQKIHLLTLPKRNHRVQLAPSVRRLINGVR